MKNKKEAVMGISVMVAARQPLPLLVIALHPTVGGGGGGAASPPEGNLVGLSANVPCPMSSKSVSPSFLILPLLKIGSIGKQK